MRRQLRMSWFHVRQFVRVPYFVQIMAMTTVTTTLVQFLAAHAWGSITPTQGWVRGGVIGMWTTATCAAGIIGFERYKGTLVHLVMAPIGALRAIAAVVCSAASFGCLSLPLAWLTWATLAWSVDLTPLGGWELPRLLLSSLMLLVGCIALSLVIAALFVLTPNAISYEGLLLVPVFALSGILFTSSRPPTWIATVSRILPLRVPFHLLLGRPVGAGDVAAWCLVVAAWLGLAAFLGRRALYLATRTGTLEIM
nr:ABC transporter permease [Actinomyces sp.]